MFNSGGHAHALAAARAHGVEQGSYLGDADAWVSKAAGSATSAGPQGGTAASQWALLFLGVQRSQEPGESAPGPGAQGSDHS